MKNRENYNTKRGVTTFVKEKSRNAFLQPPTSKDPYPNGEPIDIRMSEIDYKNKSYEVTKALYDNILVITGEKHVTRPLVAMKDGYIVLAFGTIGAAARHFGVIYETIKDACNSNTRRRIHKVYKLDWIDKALFNELKEKSEA